MAKFVYLICAISVLQLASCYVKRDAPKPPTLSELATQTEQALQQLHKNFLEFVGVKDDDELAKKIQEQAKTYAETLQASAQALSEEVKLQAGKADEALKGLSTQLQGTLEELKAKDPELAKNAELLRAKFEESLNSVLKNTEQLRTKLSEQGKEVSHNLENVMKQLYDNTREAAQKIAADVQASVKPSH